jgi:hypothetical protein
LLDHPSPLMFIAVWGKSASPHSGNALHHHGQQVSTASAFEVELRRSKDHAAGCESPTGKYQGSWAPPSLTATPGTDTRLDHSPARKVQIHTPTRQSKNWVTWLLYWRTVRSAREAFKASTTRLSIHLRTAADACCSSSRDGAGRRLGCRPTSLRNRKILGESQKKQMGSQYGGASWMVLASVL